MIIGLAGAKRAGKNTVAGFIKDQFDDKYEVQEWSFAEDLKKSAAAAIGYFNDSTVTPVQFCDSLKERGEIVIRDTDGSNGEWVISGRKYLQYYGTEAHRKVFGDDFWVDNLLDKILEANQGAGYSNPERLDVITDLRFPNEAEAVRHSDRLGKVVKIRRPEVENHGDTHVSEIPMPDELVDYHLSNYHGLEELRACTIQMIRELCQ